MTDVTAPQLSMTTANEPDGAPRIASLDVMRGIAILGILFMNINDMGQSLTASFGDIRHLGWTQADQLAWWLREVLANGTARCLLEMLFGVGMVILTERAAGAIETSTDRPAGRMRRILRWLFGNGAVLRGYYWRNIVLFVFGVVHMYILLWPGDILHSYAMAALVAVFFRRLRARWLLAIGLVFALLQLGGGGYFGYYEPMQSRSEVAAIRAKQGAGQPITKAESERLAKTDKNGADRAKGRAERDKDIAQEDKGRMGTAVTWAAEQVRISWSRFPSFGEIFSVWESAATMLIGAALFRLGIIQGSRTRRYYVVMTVVAYAIAVPLRTLGAWEQTRFDDLPKIFWATNEIARLAMTVGHIGVINLMLGSVAGLKLLKPFEAAGKTALTVYIAQTMICLWVLYPPFALGLYREQGWMALMLTALVINAGLLWGANRWVRDYRIAPVEWAWRSIVEWRRLPFRRRPRIAAGGPQLAPA